MLAALWLLVGSPMPERAKVMAQTKKGYPGHPGWGLGVRLTTPPHEKYVLLRSF